MPFEIDQQRLGKFPDADDNDMPSMAWLAACMVAGMLLWVGLFKTVDWLLASAWSLAVA